MDEHSDFENILWEGVLGVEQMGEESWDYSLNWQRLRRKAYSWESVGKTMIHSHFILKNKKVLG